MAPSQSSRARRGWRAPADASWPLANASVVLILINRARDMVLPARQSRLVACSQVPAIGAAHRVFLAIHAGFAAFNIPRLPCSHLSTPDALGNAPLLVILAFLDSLAGHLGKAGARQQCAKC